MLQFLIYANGLDTVETYFDSHVDLLQRKLQKHSDRLKMRAEETFKIKDLKIKDLKLKDLSIGDLSGDVLAENLEREIKSFKLKVRFFWLYRALACADAGNAGVCARHVAAGVVAVRQGRADTRESVIFLRRHDAAPHRAHVRYGPAV